MRKLDWQSFERIEFQKVYVSNAEGCSHPFRWMFWQYLKPEMESEGGEVETPHSPPNDQKVG